MLVRALQQSSGPLEEDVYLTLLSGGGQVESGERVGITVTPSTREREGNHRQFVLLL